MEENHKKVEDPSQENITDYDSKISPQPFLWAMFLGFMVIVFLQFIVNLLGGIAVGPFQNIGPLEWILLSLLVPAVFLFYLVPSTLLIRFLIFRWSGFKPPFLRTGGIFLTSYVLLAMLFAILLLVFFGSSFDIEDISGTLLYLLVTTYVGLASWIASAWFISENREKIILARKDGKK